MSSKRHPLILPEKDKGNRLQEYGIRETDRKKI
jgi:hypothetical protein